MKNIYKKKCITAGFTLVEILVSLSLFSIAIVGAVTLIIYNFRNYSFSFEVNQSVNEAQSSLTRMTKEIREARISESGGWPIEKADDNEFIFFSDVTNDGRTDRIRYFLVGQELRKGVTEPTVPPVTYPSSNEVITIISPYIDNQSTPLFTYYNGDWPSDQTNNPLTASNRLLNTRFVSLYLNINIPTEESAQPFELQTGVQIRSLKDNL